MTTKTARTLGALVVAALVSAGGYGSLILLGDVPVAELTGEAGFAVASCLMGGAIFGLGYYVWGHESLYGRGVDSDGT